MLEFNIMETTSIEKFYTGFYIISQLKEIETERYCYFLADTLKRMGFIRLDTAYDCNLINESHIERIAQNGVKILSNAKIITGYCLMGVIIETLDDNKIFTTELIETIREWMNSYLDAEGKDKKSYDIFIKLLNSYLNFDLSPEQLKFLTNVVELGKTDLKGIEQDIIDDAKRRANQKNTTFKNPYSKNRHSRAIINTALKKGFFAKEVISAIKTFKTLSDKFKSVISSRSL